jgi:hypothetical protein
VPRVGAVATSLVAGEDLHHDVRVHGVRSLPPVDHFAVGVVSRVDEHDGPAADAQERLVRSVVRADVREIARDPFDGWIGEPHYLEVQLRQTRAGIRLGRGDAEAALEDAERGVEVGRSARDPQAALPSLAERARVLFMMGRPQEAVETIDELFERIDRGQAIDWSVWIVTAAIVLSEVGADEFLALDIEHLPSLWMRAARHWAAGDLAGAGDTFEEIGAVPDEAYARMKEAERLLATGRRAEAEAPLSRALALSRSMGATAFIRDAERLLATPV